MNLMQALHEQWAAAAALRALLPAERVFTGPAPQTAAPWATWTRSGAKTLTIFGDGSALEAVRMRLAVRADDYDAASAIAAAARTAFALAAFPLAGADRVVSVVVADESHGKRDDGLWEVTLELDCHVHRDVPLAG